MCANSAMVMICGPLLTARRYLHWALVLPAGIMASALALITCHDFDATFLGLSCGGFGSLIVGRKSSSESAMKANESGLSACESQQR